MTPVPWQNPSVIMLPLGQRLSLPIKKTIPNWPKFCFWILWREISAKRKEDWPLAEGRRVGEKPHWPSTPTNARLLAGQKCEETPCMKEGGTKSHKLVYATQVYLLYIRTAIVKSFHTCQPKSRFLAYSSNIWLPSTYLHFIEPFSPYVMEETARYTSSSQASSPFCKWISPGAPKEKAHATQNKIPRDLSPINGWAFPGSGRLGPAPAFGLAPWTWWRGICVYGPAVASRSPALYRSPQHEISRYLFCVCRSPGDQTPSNRETKKKE